MPLRLFRRRPKPFQELIDHQLARFAEENSALMSELDDERRRYRQAGSQTAEERFGDVQDVAEEGRDALERLRETYAVTLVEDAADDYRFEFDRSAAQRYPQFALDLDIWARDDD